MQSLDEDKTKNYFLLFICLSASWQFMDHRLNIVLRIYSESQTKKITDFHDNMLKSCTVNKK